MIWILWLLLTQMVCTMARTPNVDWCLYWRYLNKDQFRPECNGVYRLRFSKNKVYDQQNTRVAMIPVTRNLIGNKFAQCTFKESNCQRSTMCSSGQLCSDFSGYCCGSQKILTQCPPADTLASNCSPFRKYVNWCDTNADCAPHLAKRENKMYNAANMLDSLNRFPSLCCPTSCGYNVCIR